MIAYVWGVYPRDSSRPMAAAGMTDDESRARMLVATILAGDETTIAGVMQPVSVDSESLHTDDLSPDWPPAGPAMECRRNDNGGVTWHPLFRYPWN